MGLKEVVRISVLEHFEFYERQEIVYQLKYYQPLKDDFSYRSQYANEIGKQGPMKSCSTTVLS